MSDTNASTVTVKRRRGRPRLDPDKRQRPEIYVRMPSALEERLKRDAQIANRSLTKEIEVRLERSYLRDEIYGGSKMAAMFREMADIALGMERQHEGRSFFDDFRVFVQVSKIWEDFIKRWMPRPDDELLAEVRNRWEAAWGKGIRSPGRITHTSAEDAALAWLILHTPPPPGMTLVSILAGALEPVISKPAGAPEPASDKSAETPEPEATGDIAIPPKPPESLSTAFPGGAAWQIGSLAKVMDGLIRLQGSASAAAGEVSQLVQLLAEAMEEPAGGDAAVPPIDAATDVAAAPKIVAEKGGPGRRNLGVRQSS
jgi:hypothetical protein